MRSVFSDQTAPARAGAGRPGAPFGRTRGGTDERPNLVSTSIVTGFALFAMLFGAGNIIFPPYIGLVAGQDWVLGLIAYFFADIGLAIMAWAALLTSRSVDRLENIFYRLGYYPSRLLTGGIILSVAYIAGPRTCTVSYDLTLAPFFGDEPWVRLAYTSVYSLLGWACCIREDKMIELIGRRITPVLVLSLLTLIIVGMVNPLGYEMLPARADNIWVMGLMSGYQTMDAACAVVFGFIIAQDLAGRGYRSLESKIKVITYAVWVMGFLMLVVYCGLCYIGAAASAQYGVGIRHGALVLSIFQNALGLEGRVLLSFVVFLACVSTSAALVGAAATFLARLSGGRLEYGLLATLIALSFGLISCTGLANILAIAVPVILMLFPAFFLMAVISLFDRRIRNVNIYRFGVGFTLAYSILEVLRRQGVEAVSFITALPLQELGFGWALPAALGCAAGYLARRGRAGEPPPAKR
ncbi:MAG: branched-chain amino acid transport system II carrier protein [Deltaproteobacteria bacterium]|jgi:LIVCS family branched-chain amino acid:cation transporter|nr:branched-chain amino acid transport system II carrier protein [Deltaproteobacteria bacterium]